MASQPVASEDLTLLEIDSVVRVHHVRGTPQLGQTFTLDLHIHDDQGNTCRAEPLLKLLLVATIDTCIRASCEALISIVSQKLCLLCVHAFYNALC